MTPMKSAGRVPKKIPFTKDGYQKLQTDLALFTTKRKGAVINLRTARDMGDLSENAAYKAARMELSAIDRQIRRLTYLLRYGVIVEKHGSAEVDFGSRVTLDNGKTKMTFDLVGGYESDPKQEKLSVFSPIGKAILHKHVGDAVTVHAPVGEINYTIVEIN